MMTRFAKFWSGIVYKYAVMILLVAVIVTYVAIKATMNISVSTRLEGLMPQGAESVKTLNDALKKTGSFASIQIVATSDDPATSLQFIKDTKTAIDTYDWVESSQYFEDVEVLEEHKLLLLSLEQLQELEADINEAYPTIVAQQLSEMWGPEVTFTLRGENLVGKSTTVLDQSRIDEIQDSVSSTPQTERYFKSEDEKTMVLVVWPKEGLDSLTDAKQMVIDSNRVVEGLDAASYGQNIQVGVAGRIANKVAQFDAIINDLKTGLLWSISLIALLIIISYRSIAAIPAIFIPLSIGIVWTLGMTTVTIGGLNLITVFLTLILFGLGIDFGIHNFSRFREERRGGMSTPDALTIVIQNTGSASLIAALTTSLAFFSLMLTEFRAFTEFGAIAGMGIVLTFISMYSIFPALLVVMERLGWKASAIPKGIWLLRMGRTDSLNPLAYRKPIGWIAIAILIVAGYFSMHVPFERNIKNLEAQQPAELSEATKMVGKVFTGKTDRAIVVVETQEELLAIDTYFKDLIKKDTETPTIEKVSSLLDFVPDQSQQIERLAVIARLGERAEALQAFDPSKYKATKRYLTIEDLNIVDLPDALRRTYLGTDSEPGYLLYIYNSVSMDDSVLARQFYDDAAGFKIGDKQYYAASEGFIFVEMIALMKADAIKAISLVLITTAILVFFFIRSWRGTIVVLIPPLLGVLLTIGIMGAFGPPLSIMNMVILPSLIGIAVDNAIHIFHRFEHEGEKADIANIMNTTGRAAILTTLTTLIGFGGMITASMGGLRSMGLLAIIGFISCLVMTWVLLPVLMQIYRERVYLKGEQVGSD
jgi:predicted RND superfamily exporter protein